MKLKTVKSCLAAVIALAAALVSTVASAYDDGVLSTPDDTVVRKDVGGGRYAYVFTNGAAATTAMLKQNAVLIEALVVAGGGGGGGRAPSSGHASGGGGAGGFAYYPELGLSLASGSVFDIVVGAGGAGGLGQQAGANGSDSVLSFAGRSFVVPGGGGGAMGYGTGSPGREGASGGGGSGQDPAGPGTAGFGYAGALGTLKNGDHAGGGGGAGGPGLVWVSGKGGAGGPGRICPITGEQICYAGGGAPSNGQPGEGGGGGNASGAGVDGLGGGGGGSDTAAIAGGSGGSGTIILLLTAQDWLVADDILPQTLIPGTPCEPHPAVSTTGGETLTEDEDYVLSWTNNMSVGTATVTVKGVSDYDGMFVRVPFQITLARFSDEFIESSDVTCRRLTVGDRMVYVFTNTSAQVSLRANAAFLIDSALIVAGGGGGGAGDNGAGTNNGGGGGGGAGGVIALTNAPVYVAANAMMTLTVGAGGIGSSSGASAGNLGGNSTLSCGDLLLIAKGGGGGGGYKKGGAIAGAAGGSGGGGSYGANGGAGTDGQGFAGAKSGNYGSATAGGGGGGGGVGGEYVASVSPVSAHAGNGGPGVTNDITGVAVCYAGGGGAGGASGSSHGGQGGIGGGAEGGCSYAGHDGVDGLGGGGGGGGCQSSVGKPGGRGGSGIVILSLKAFPFSVASIPDQLYAGEEVKPALSLTDSSTGEALFAGEDYEVAYANNTAPGVATAAITGRGKYAGADISVPFVIYSRLYVAADAAEGGDGSDWDHPMPFASALAASVNRTSEIWMKAGDYAFAADGTELEFASGLKVVGGFAGNPAQADQLADPAVTILDGGAAFDLMKVVNGAGAPLSFERVAFRNAKTRAFQKNGAGALSFRNCVFENNGRATSNVKGRGLYALGDSTAVLTFSNCVFKGNMYAGTSAFGYGGALCLESLARTDLEDCLFVTNGQKLAASGGSPYPAAGSAIYAKSAPIVARRCRFAANVMGVNNAKNVTSVDGGCIRLEGACGGTVFENCVWTGNAEWRCSTSWLIPDGGTISVVLDSSSAQVNLKNCTVAYNASGANQSSAGLTVVRGTVLVDDSIIFRNVRGLEDAAYGNDIHVAAAGRAAVRHSLITSSAQYYVSGLDTGLLTLDSNTVSEGDPSLVTSADDFEALLVTDSYRHFIVADSAYATLAAIDAHLLSSAGYWLNDGTAGPATAVNSSALDRGNPAADYSREPKPNGGRLNLGAYGNTSEASKSATGQPKVTAFTAEQADTTTPRVRVALTLGSDDGQGYAAAAEIICTTNGAFACSRTWDNQGLGSNIEWLLPIYFNRGDVVKVAYSVTVPGASEGTGEKSVEITADRPDWVGKGGGEDVVHVRLGADCWQNGKNWADAYPDIQTALTAAEADSTKHEIWLMAETFDERLAFSPQTTFAIRGGFTGRECTPEERPAGTRTTLTFSGLHRALTVENGAAVTVERIDFVRADTAAFAKTGAGGLVVRDCRFADNGHGSDGAGLALHATGSAGALLVVSNCVFEGQRPADSCSEGATVRVASFARATFDDCLFMTNGIAFGNPSGDHVSCQARGAAFLAKGVPVTMRNCRFAGNSAGNCSPSSASDGSDHGGVCVLAGACGGSAFTNCAWVANAERTSQSFDSSQSGGAMVLALDDAAAAVDFRNCTFAYNVSTAGRSAAGLNIFKGTASVGDSIFYGNIHGNYVHTNANDITVQAAGTLNLAHSLVTELGSNGVSGVQGSVIGIDTPTMLEGDPKFVSTTNDLGSAITYQRVLIAKSTPYYLYRYYTFFKVEDATWAKMAAMNIHLRGGSGYEDERTGEKVKAYRRSGNSPAIDAGVGNYRNEPTPNGGRVNLGFYGNTPWATMSKGGLLIWVK